MSCAGDQSQQVDTEAGPGTRKCPYKLAIIGGGPAGCSIVVRAIRTGFFSDLCGFTENYETSLPPVDKILCSSSVDDMTTAEVQSTKVNILSGNKTRLSSGTRAAGVCLVDAGPSRDFGGGKLQHYVINSNTWAGKFATNVLEEKPDTMPKESSQNTLLDKLKTQRSTKVLEEFGNQVAPLEMVGDFLRDVGAVVRDSIAKYPESSCCLLETRVMSLQRVRVPHDDDDDGKREPLVLWKIDMRRQEASGSITSDVQVVYAHHVALATGGVQAIPKLPNAAHNKKLMGSDFVCTEEGVRVLRQKLHKAAQQSLITPGAAALPVGPGRVVIVGGSHSAFSAAWICLQRLNGPFSASAIARYDSKPEDGQDRSAATSIGEGDGLTPLRLSQNSICLLHRSAIKVFYTTRAEAERDSYSYPVTGGCTECSSPAGSSAQPVPQSSNGLSAIVSKVTGQIFPFGGLRGDAKRLWYRVKTGAELRIKLMQLKQNVVIVPQHDDFHSATPSNVKKQQSIVERLFDEATVIIWACGYTSSKIPIVDFDGVTPLSLSSTGGLIEVDHLARVIDAANLQLEANTAQTFGKVLLDSPVKENTAVSSPVAGDRGIAKKGNDQSRPVIERLMGTGLGYGLTAVQDNGQPDRSAGRADGVAVYLKRAATLILAQVLGEQVYGGNGIRSWEERTTMLRKMALVASVSSGSGKQTPCASPQRPIIGSRASTPLPSSGSNRMRSFAVVGSGASRPHTSNSSQLLNRSSSDLRTIPSSNSIEQQQSAKRSQSRCRSRMLITNNASQSPSKINNNCEDSEDKKIDTTILSKSLPTPLILPVMSNTTELQNREDQRLEDLVRPVSSSLKAKSALSPFPSIANKADEGKINNITSSSKKCASPVAAVRRRLSPRSLISTDKVEVGAAGNGTSPAGSAVEDGLSKNSIESSPLSIGKKQKRLTQQLKSTEALHSRDSRSRTAAVIPPSSHNKQRHLTTSTRVTAAQLSGLSTLKKQ